MSLGVKLVQNPLFSFHGIVLQLIINCNKTIFSSLRKKQMKLKKWVLDNFDNFYLSENKI